jgi:hypothetical protein
MQPQQQQPGQPEQQQPGPAHGIPGEGWGLWPQGLDEQAQQDADIVQAIPAVYPLNFDLNQPLEQVDDDLGVVENFPGPLQLPRQPAEPMDEDIIVASSDSEGALSSNWHLNSNWQQSSKRSMSSSLWKMVLPCN